MLLSSFFSIYTLQRELAICSHDVLALNKDFTDLFAFVRSSFFRPDVSTESATTSLKGHMDGCRSSSEASQRSDDITVDSEVSVRHYIRFPMSMDLLLL